MSISDYMELTPMQLDALREMGSIGTGNAANALSEMIGCEVRIQMPEVRI
jgi:chemotaxis protein CheC